MTAKKIQKQTIKEKTPWIFKPALLFLVMLAIGFTTYAPELKGDFIFDDSFYVQNNPNIENFSTLIHWNGFRNQRPLYWFSFYLGKKLWGNNPAGYKVVNLLSHILTAFILFLFLLHLLEMKGIYNRWFALAASMLFLVSPLATEAVSYISGRNNGIGGLFFILGCFIFLKSLETPIRRKQLYRLTGSLAAFITAILFKEVYIVFILFYPLIYLWVRPVSTKTAFKVSAAALLPIMAILLLSYVVPVSPFNRIHRMIVQNIHHFDSKPLATNATAVAYSLRLFLFPDALNIDHDLPVVSHLTDPIALLSISLLLGLGLLLFFLRKKLPLSFLSYLAYLILIAPTNSFILRHGGWMIDPLSERNLYACAIFFSIIAIELVTVLIRKETSRRVVLAILLLSFTARTFTRNMDFSNNIALWKSSVHCSPNRARPNYNLAVALKDAGNIDKAIPFAKRALLLSPRSQSYGLLASLLLRNGKKQEAKQTLIEGIQVVGKNRALLLNQLGQLYYSQGQFDQAEKYLSRSLQANPRLIQAALTLMMIQLDNGNLIAAQATIEKIQWHIRKQSRTFKSEQVVDNNMRAMLAFGRGLLFFQSGRPKAGIQFCKKAIRLNSDFTEPMIKLGEYYYAQKKYKESWSQFLKASRTPGFKRYTAAAGPYMRNLQKLLDNPELDPGL